MGLFSRSEDTRERTPKEAERRVVRGDWPENDPRHLANLTLTSLGLVNVWWWDGQIEDLWQTLARHSPELAQLAPPVGGLSRLARDSDVYVFGVEGPHGSAVAVGSGPDADSRMLVEEIMMPLQDVTRQGVTHDMVINSGQTSESAARVLESGHVVALSELALPGRPAPESCTVLPPHVRRQLAGWTERLHDLYRLDLTDADGDTVTAWCMLHDGRPALVYPFFEEPGGNLEPFQPLRAHFGGDLIWTDPRVAAVLELPRGDDPRVVAQRLVDDVARGLTVLAGQREQAPAAPAPAGSAEPAEAPQPDRTTSLSSWQDVLTLLRTTYTIAEERRGDDGEVEYCRLLFDVGDDRSQLVVVERHVMADQDWVRVSSAFAPVEGADLLAALTRVGDYVCGAVRRSGEALTLTHCQAVRGLHPESFREALRIIVVCADRLEREFGSGDVF